MLIKAQNLITKISDNDQINAENYMESLEYITNLYRFLKNLQDVVPLSKVNFLPSFKGRLVIEKLGILATDKESTMKVFRVSSKLFLEDEIRKELKETFNSMCESIIFSEDTVNFILV